MSDLKNVSQEGKNFAARKVCETQAAKALQAKRRFWGGKMALPVHHHVGTK